MPTPLPAFAWGSRSMRRVFFSATARPADKLTAVVVFPTPPFWFAVAALPPTGTPVTRETFPAAVRRAHPGPRSGRRIIGEADAIRTFHVKRPDSAARRPPQDKSGQTY